MGGNTMKIPTSLVLSFLLVVASAAFAADLDQAKRDGLVGERADGYLGLVDPEASPDVRALVADVNEKRKAEYLRIAAGNSLEVSQVEALAGKKAIERTQPGGWILLDGGWQKK
jgi:uncharacterized protein YdbL (DUF1318 family)